MPLRPRQAERAAPPEEAHQPDLAERLVDLLALADDGSSTRQLADELGVDPIRVRRELVELEALGVVARTGSTRATRWWLG